MKNSDSSPVQDATIKIYSNSGRLIGEYPGSTIAEALSNANLSSANLRYANLSSANLSSANLSYANLSYADLSSADLSSANLSSANLSYANLRYANLSSANLSSANLSYANLSYADLRSANLRSANLPSPGSVLLAQWGFLSEAATVALMRFDASAHPDPEAFDRWKESGECPYSQCRVQRAALFAEDRNLWAPGSPPTLWEAMCMVLDEKCPGWRGEPK